MPCPHDGTTVQMKTDKNFQVIPFRFLAACRIGSGTVLLGWAEDELNPVSVINCFHSDGRSENFELGKGELPLIRTLKPDFTSSGLKIRHRDTITTGRGFAVLLPISPASFATAMFTLNNQVADLERVALQEAKTLLELEGYLSVYGHALHAFATEAADKAFLDLLLPLLLQQAENPVTPAASIDQVWQFEDQLLITGKIDCDQSQLKKIELRAGSTHIDTSGQVRTMLVSRSELNLQRTAGDLVCVFCILIELPKTLQAKKATSAPGTRSKVTAARKISMIIETENLGRLTLHASLHQCELAFIKNILQAMPTAAEEVLAGLHRRFRSGPAARIVREASREHFIRQWSRSESKVRFGKTFAAGTERVFHFGESGLLVFGWLVYPLGNEVKVWLHSGDKAPQDVSAAMVYIDLDRHHKLRKEFPRAGSSPFFVLHVPHPTMTGSRRALQFSVSGLPDAWLKLDTTTLHEQGMPLVRQMLSALPRADNLRLQMIKLFNSGLGNAITWAARDQMEISKKAPTQEVQFGKPVAKPVVSLIIPLFGRCDYLRHQMAAFAEDAQFRQVDLVYVVDDPGILAATLDLAGRYQPLFNIPLRVIHYGENRGFAGANNAAAKVARAPLLLLMNSDVLPQHKGWIGKLRTALEKLPKAGMTAPLLEYADNSLQHGGMRPMRHHPYPGYVFSYHPGKGQKWEGGNKPQEQLMLTGACLLIRKSDYERAKGLDEGYLVGDFEDSDFSLRMRARGKKLYLVPAAKLWHLERQSQYLGDNTTTLRDLLTLYNGWRYKQKIDQGLLPDPEKMQVVTSS